MSHCSVGKRADAATARGDGHRASRWMQNGGTSGIRGPGAPGPGGMIPGFSGCDSGCPASLGSAIQAWLCRVYRYFCILQNAFNKSLPVSIQQNQSLLLAIKSPNYCPFCTKITVINKISMAEVGVGVGVRAGRGSHNFDSPSLGKLVILKRKSKGGMASSAPVLSWTQTVCLFTRGRSNGDKKGIKTSPKTRKFPKPETSSR